MSARMLTPSKRRKAVKSPRVTRDSKVLPKRSQADENEPPDLDAILGAFGDARDLVAVVYTAFQANGRDGPEQSVLCHAIKGLDSACDQLDAAAHKIERYWERHANAVRGES
jgi:hypothetical protein